MFSSLKLLRQGRFYYVVVTFLSVEVLEMEVRYCDITACLHTGEFFRNLNSDDPQEIIIIPENCFPNGDGKVTSLDDFCQLLRATIYWTLDEIPLEVLDFCKWTKPEVWQTALEAIPGVEEANILAALMNAYSNPLEVEEPTGLLDTGRMEVFAHVVDRIPRDGSTMVTVAGMGNLRALRFLHEYGFAFPAGNMVTFAAAENGHLDCLQYAYEQGVEWDSDVCGVAAFRGHLDCLQYALSEGCPHDGGASIAACETGHLHCLQLLHEYDNPWSVTTSQYAAMHPDATCLKYLHENGCPWDAETLFCAAESASIKCLRYACAHGCTIDLDIVGCAAQRGNLECLQYLVGELHLEMTMYVFIIALLAGNLECLRYLIDHGSPYLEAEFDNNEESFQLYDHAFIKNNPEFVQCVEFVMKCGWVPNKGFIRYIMERDLENCRELCAREGWLSLFDSLFWWIGGRISSS